MFERRDLPWVYALFIVCALATRILYRKDLPRWRRCIFVWLMASWALATIPNLDGELNRVKLDHFLLGGLSTEQKRERLIYADFYRFIKFCKENIPPGASVGQRFPNEYFVTLGSYLLYPIELKGDDYLLVYHQQEEGGGSREAAAPTLEADDSEKIISEGSDKYETFKQFSRNSVILKKRNEGDSVRHESSEIAEASWRVMAKGSYVLSAYWIVILVLWSMRGRARFGNFDATHKATTSLTGGAGVFTLWLFVSGIALKWLLRLLFIAWFIVLNMGLICLQFYLERARKESKPAGAKDEKSLDRAKVHWLWIFVICVLIVAQMGFILFEALTVPIGRAGNEEWATSDWDIWSIWGFKAKAFSAFNTLPQGFFTAPHFHFAHLDYPLHLPILAAYLGGGDVSVRLISVIFFVALLILFFSISAAKFGYRCAVIFSSLLITMPQLIKFAPTGYADVALAFYFFAAVALFYIWMERHVEWALLASGLLAGVAGWTKNEGVVLACVLTVVLVAYLLQHRSALSGKRWIYLMQFALPVAAINAPWIIFKRVVEVEPYMATPPLATMSDVLKHVQRIPEIISYAFHHFFLDASLPRWNILWFMLVVALLVNPKKILKGPNAYVFLTFVLALAAYLGFYVFTPHDLKWHLGTSFDRLMLHLAPVALFLSAVMINRRDAEGAEIVPIPNDEKTIL